MSIPILTVIIPCKNEGNGVLRCLNLLAHQSIPLRILIADSSTNPADIESLQSYVKQRSNMEIISGGMPSIARNAGARAATTPYIAFIDADIMIYDTKLLEQCLYRMQDYELITARMRCDDGKWNRVWGIFLTIQTIMSKSRPFALGGFQMWRGDAFWMHGGFDERAEVAEDWLLSQRVHPKSFKIVERNIWTGGRRFNRYGIWDMLILMLKSWWNRNNVEWFYTSHNYWKNEKKN